MFSEFYKWLVKQLPNDIKNIEAYVNKKNYKSQSILNYLDLVELGDNKNGNSFYYNRKNNEVNNMSLLEYLQNNISTKNTLDEIINIFEEMCKTPIEEELLLNEYGVYDYTGEDLFYYDLVRQYPDGEDEYYQLRVSIIFSLDEENRYLEATLWSDDSDENFFNYIRKSDGYNYAKNHKFKSIDIRIDQT